MKKYSALMLAAALALSLVACSGGGAGDTNTPSTGNGDITSTNIPSGGGEDEPTGTELPQSTSLELNTKYTVPDYADFTLVGITTTDKVQGSMGGGRYYYNDDGDPYIDVVFDLVNTNANTIDSDDVMKFTAVSSTGTEYEASLYCVETDGMTDVSQYESISPMSSVRFHASATVPSSEKEFTLNFDINGSIYSCAYQTNTEVKTIIDLHPGDVIENDDYASMEFVGYEFTEDLLPPNTSSAYRHYQVDSPDSIYLVLKYNITNYQANKKDIDTFVGVTAIFADKYKYTGFVIREDDDGKGFSAYNDIEPLTSAHLYYLIEVPKTVMDMSFSVRTTFDKQEYQFSAQP